ncbi:MAG: dehydrogenase subunit, partial [Mycobacterium sp.]|nr:dehydrogenase subunit [Mycobacterium sp.]
MTSFPWLTAIWAVPMVGAGMVMLVPAAQRTLAKWVAVAVSVIVLALAV